MTGMKPNQSLAHRPRLAKMQSRVVIIGNSGAGKSFLARRLGQMVQTKATHLDRLFWVPGGFNEKRSAEVVEREIMKTKLAGAWIVEGVFGELAAQFLDSAELLIWLDMPWETCRAGLLARGSESAKQLDPVRAEESFQLLLDWAADYWKRTDLRSHFGHARLFAEFTGDKIRFDQRAVIDQYLSEEEPNKCPRPTLASDLPG
jgi:adenylate kinase family enzyme